MHDTTQFLVAGDMHTRADASATMCTTLHRTLPTAFAASIAVAAKTMTNTEIIKTLKPYLKREELTNNTDVNLTALGSVTNKMCLRCTLLGHGDSAAFSIPTRPIFNFSGARVGTCEDKRQRNKHKHLDSR